MGKPYPIELRKRVVEHVLAGGHIAVRLHDLKFPPNMFTMS